MWIRRSRRCWTTAPSHPSPIGWPPPWIPAICRKRYAGTDSYRADPKRRYVDTEEELNSLAYRLLHEKRMDQAIAIFELNATEHPTSSNVWDSLGEACLLAGRREAAIQHYRKSLELDPSNENARSVLAQLRL